MNINAKKNAFPNPTRTATSCLHERLPVAASSAHVQPNASPIFDAPPASRITHVANAIAMNPIAYRARQFTRVAPSDVAFAPPPPSTSRVASSFLSDASPRPRHAFAHVVAKHVPQHAPTHADIPALSRAPSSSAPLAHARASSSRAESNGHVARSSPIGNSRQLVFLKIECESRVAV